MLNIDLTYYQPTVNIEHTSNNHELNRLLSAAIVSTGFRNLLITDPEGAIAKGYMGEKFDLTNDEYRWLMSVQATDLASFATQLLEFQNIRSSANNLAIPVKIPAKAYANKGDMVEIDWLPGHFSTS
jgi:hypothetical protein